MESKVSHLGDIKHLYLRLLTKRLKDRNEYRTQGRDESDIFWFKANIPSTNILCLMR